MSTSLRSKLIRTRLCSCNNNKATSSPRSTLYPYFHLSTRPYAVLVNKSSSVDSSFGKNPPAAPSQISNSSPSLRTRTPIGAQVRGDPFPNRDPINRDTPPSSWGRGLGGKAPSAPNIPQSESSSSAAIKVTNHQSESNHQGSSSDREHPHSASIPDQNGNFNTLDSKILKAARALLRQQQKEESLPSSSTSTSTTITRSDKDNDSAHEQSPSDLNDLLASFTALANNQLPFSLPYEPTPDQSRKVPLTNARSTPSEIESAKDDGVLLVAYVDGLEIEGTTGHGDPSRSEPKISVCSGFAVEGKKMLADKGVGKGELLITCAHTLQSCLPRSSSTSQAQSSSTSSLGLVMTRTGQVYRIHSLLSSLPSSDLILLQLSEKPISLDSLNASSSSTSVSSGLRTLPLSPYPSPVGTELCVSSFSGWENDSWASAMGKAAAAFSTRSTSTTSDSSDVYAHGLKPNPNFDSNPLDASSEAEERARARGRWGRARLVEYKDPSGREAKTGTYDELSQLEFKILTDSNENLPSFLAASTTSSHQSTTSSSSPSGGGSQDQIETTGTSNNLPLFATLSNFPPPGSSGGPIVDISSGAVVGVVRGSKMSALEGRRGDAIPAEKIFEFFALPGIGSNKL